MKNEEYTKELGSFVMGFEEAKDLFRGNDKDTYHRTLSIADSKVGPILELEDLEYSYVTHFIKGNGITFCSKAAAFHVASELGIEPTDTTEVTAWLIGQKTVMVKVFDTNTRPKSATGVCPIFNLLKMGYELGYITEYKQFYLHNTFAEDDLLKKGVEITGPFKTQFTDVLDNNPFNWKVVVKDITNTKLICTCTHIGEYRINK